MGKKNIDLFLITGFLGSGKTTLLQNVLPAFEKQKVGVLVNEFGELGIDGKIIEKKGLELKEIENGSIFCSCLEDSFLQALEVFAELPLDMLLIETSGLSDPANMEKILSKAEDISVKNYNYRGSVCMVDASNFLKVLSTNQTVKKQIMYSDLIVINKLDLAAEETVDEVRKKIKSLNPAAEMIETTYSRLAVDFLVKLNLQDKSITEESGNTPFNRPETYVLKSKTNLSKAIWKKILADIAEFVFRIKGFILTTEGSFYVDGVGQEISLKEFDSKRQESEVVLITASENMAALQKKITELPEQIEIK